MENGTLSEIRVVSLDRFRVARYVVISPDPEEMVIAYMDEWAKKSGLLNQPSYRKKRIGWDFPFVTEEQQKNFGLRGYVSAYVIPDDFVPACGGAELAFVEADTYAVVTITDPHSDSFATIPRAYGMLIDYAKPVSWENRLAFEEEYDKDGVHYMDVYVPMN